MMLAGMAMLVGLALEILTPGVEVSLTRFPGYRSPIVNAASVLSPAVTPAARPAATPERKPSRLTVNAATGVVHFTVRTPGAHIVVRRTDIPNAPEQTVTQKSLSLAAGHWVATATAPGCRNWMTYFSVSPEGPTNLLIRLRPCTPAETSSPKKHKIVSAEAHGHSRRPS